MRRFLRAFALGLLIGGLAGLWFGINIGRDAPLLSNPLTVHEPAAQERLADRSGGASAG